MVSMAPERRSDAWLERHVHDWVDEGLISSAQADAIGQYEHLGGPHEPRRLTLVAEVAAYLGTVLALMGGAVVVGDSWRDLTFFGQMALGAAIAVIGFAAGAWLMRLDEPGAVRLGGFLWMLGAGGVAIVVGVVVDEIDPRDGAWLVLAVGLAVFVTGMTLWRNLDRPLQLVTAAIGFAFAFGAAGELLDTEVWIGGIVAIAIGAVLAIGAIADRFRPPLVALVVGGVSAYVGAFMLGDYNRHLGPAIALVVASALVVHSLQRGLVPVLVLAVIGALIATQALLSTTFTGAVSSLIVTLIGLAIVVAVIMRTRERA